MIAFGPVPSRRLGQSLGINHIPHKICSYDCVYCQVGPTPLEIIERRHFYTPSVIFEAVRQKVEETRTAGGLIDYLTFVPDGEPGLDIHLGESIDLLRPLGIPVAVISNASLIWRSDVQEAMARADLVSLKIDAVSEDRWRQINRPHAVLSLAVILEGAIAFSKEYTGDLITETMLLKGVNDDEENLRAIADYLRRLQPAIAYLGAPTRPPSESWVQPPNEQAFARAYQLFSERVKKVELLMGYPPEAFSPAGDAAQNILDITAVHPMRESEALETLAQSGAPASLLDELIAKKKLARVEYGGWIFYVRKVDRWREQL